MPVHHQKMPSLQSKVTSFLQEGKCQRLPHAFFRMALRPALIELPFLLPRWVSEGWKVFPLSSTFALGPPFPPVSLLPWGQMKTKKNVAPQRRHKMKLGLHLALNSKIQQNSSPFFFFFFFFKCSVYNHRCILQFAAFWVACKKFHPFSSRLQGKPGGPLVITCLGTGNGCLRAESTGGLCPPGS